jgi:mono/diheme cytochrome c family protein
MRYGALAIAVASLAVAAVAAQDPKQVDVGRDLFSAKQCTKCHQVAGKGNKANKLDGVASKLTEADMRKWLTSPAEMEATLDHKPKIKMSSKKVPLKQAEVDSLVAYLQMLK